jgi:hypothetical protein
MSAFSLHISLCDIADNLHSTAHKHSLHSVLGTPVYRWGMCTDSQVSRSPLSIITSPIINLSCTNTSHRTQSVSIRGTNPLLFHTEIMLYCKNHIVHTHTQSLRSKCRVSSLKHCGMYTNHQADVQIYSHSYDFTSFIKQKEGN